MILTHKKAALFPALAVLAMVGCWSGEVQSPNTAKGVPALADFIALVEKVKTGQSHPLPAINKANELFKTGGRVSVAQVKELQPYLTKADGAVRHYTLLEIDRGNEGYWVRLTIDSKNNTVVNMDARGFQKDP